METPREAWSGSRHRSPSTCKVMSFMVVGTGRPRALAAVPVRWILRLSSLGPRPPTAVPALLRLIVARSSPAARVPREPLSIADHQVRDILRLRLRCRGNHRHIADHHVRDVV